MMPLIQPVSISLVSRAILNSSIKQIRPTNHLRSCTILLKRPISSEEKFRNKSNITPILVGKGNLLQPNKDNKSSHEAMIDSDSDTADEDSIYDREFADMKVEDFESLYKDDTTSTTKAQIETVLGEYEFHKYNSMGRVPSNISPVDMARFLTEGPTPNTRDKIFTFLYKREMVKRGALSKKRRDQADKAVVRKAKIRELTDKYGLQRTGLLSDDGELIYGLWHNSLFCRIPETKIKNGASNSRLNEAALFNNKLVFDFGFEDFMTPWTCRNAVDQVQEAYGLNRYNYQEPFDLWFCNFDEKSMGGQYLANNSLQNLHNNSMITIKNDCFTNYFDKSRLVYLSPNAKDRVDTIGNNDDIYIIGVYNDKGSSKPLTYRKAESLGIRSKSLPLDNHLAWQGGSKCLCVNHVTGILLEVMANGGNWRSAMIKHIPQRKIKSNEVVIEEEQQRNSRFRLKMANKRKTMRFSLRDDLDL